MKSDGRDFFSLATNAAVLTTKGWEMAIMIGSKVKFREGMKKIQPRNLKSMLSVANVVVDWNGTTETTSEICFGVMNKSNPTVQQWSTSHHHSQPGLVGSSKPNNNRPKTTCGNEKQNASYSEFQNANSCYRLKPPIRRFSAAEIAEWKAEVHGFKSVEKFYDRHRCPGKELWLFVVQEEGNEHEWDGESEKRVNDYIREISARAKLSLNFWLGISSRRTIKLMGTNQAESLVVSIDNNTTHNSISKDVKLEYSGTCFLSLEWGNVEIILYILRLKTFGEMNGISWPQSLQLKGMIHETEVMVTIGSVVSHKIMSTEVVQRLGELGLIAEAMSVYRLIVRTGLTINVVGICRNVELDEELVVRTDIELQGIYMVTSYLLCNAVAILVTQWIETLGEMKMFGLCFRQDEKCQALSSKLFIKWKCQALLCNLEDKVIFKQWGNDTYEAKKVIVLPKYPEEEASLMMVEVVYFSGICAWLLGKDISIVATKTKERRGISELQVLMLGTRKQSHVMKASDGSYGHTFVMSLLVSYVITWAVWDDDPDAERQSWECLVIVLKFSCSREDTPTQTFYLLGLVFSWSEKNKQEQTAVVLDFVTVAGQVGERCPKIKAIPRKMEMFTKLCSLMMLSSKNKRSCCKQKLGDNATLEGYLAVCIAWIVVSNVGPQVGNKSVMHVRASSYNEAMIVSVGVYHNMKSASKKKHGQGELLIKWRHLPDHDHLENERVSSTISFIPSTLRTRSILKGPVLLGMFLYAHLVSSQTRERPKEVNLWPNPMIVSSLESLTSRRYMKKTRQRGIMVKDDDTLPAHGKVVICTWELCYLGSLLVHFVIHQVV
ncbi:hypothetical protein AALP_AA8G266000 [Arabis alpina]|uniref:Uncharacterized protein n=1 Tax=Arabis alpina TaxID=50452 RepID=A0A087G9L8_ARAAL|nr:hypothetical protein AALP_AA8G266000 [Arabis alpina]